MRKSDFYVIADNWSEVGSQFSGPWYLGCVMLISWYKPDGSGTR